MRWAANAFALLGFLVSLPLWFWFDRAADGFQFVEKAPWIPSIGVQYLFGVDGISTLLILLTTLLGFDRRPLLVDGDHRPRPAVLRLPAAPAGRHAGHVLRPRHVPLLRVLGGHAGPDVLPDRDLGRRAAALRGDQVLPVHAGRLGGDAARHPRPLLPREEDAGLRGDGQLRLHGVDADGDPGGPAVLGLPGLLPGLRDQGADVPVPHLAPRRPRRGPHRGLRDPGRRPPEDGDLRLRPLLAAAPAAGDARGGALDGDALDHRHRLRRPRDPRAEGHEEAHRLLVGEPPRLRDARDVRPQPARARGQRPADGQPRPLHRRALPPRRAHLRAAAHQGDRGSSAASPT